MLTLVGIILMTSCKNESLKVISFIEVPTVNKSSEPSLHLSENGTIYLNWMETDSLSSWLKFATLNESDMWSDPVTIATGVNWFVNWADFPSLTSFGNNLVAHYLEKSADDTYAYNVALKISNDNGNTWNSAFIPHKDATNTEHGFVSKIAIDSDNFLSVWLDGRQYAYAELDSILNKEMTLRAAIIDKDGEITNEFLLDSRVCDCCQTDVAMTKQGPIAVYRDRSDNEIRDIYSVRYVSGEWTEPQVIASDLWEIAGCPVNGPAISANENNVVVAWFTAATGQPRVKLVFSSDGGSTFSNAIQTDFTRPLGRVDVELLKDGTALVSWMDIINEETLILLQKIDAKGQKSTPFVLSKSSESRSSGFPRLIVKDDYIYAAWTALNENGSNISSAKINLDHIK